MDQWVKPDAPRLIQFYPQGGKRELLSIEPPADVLRYAMWWEQLYIHTHTHKYIYISNKHNK